jgi:SpoVK/Ycf46/Vps4 family AAA+-type ATPase
MVKNDEATHSTLLNLMQGIKENDFYIIASTNDPEKIDRALLQPQRFGIPIYCGLPVPEARREILSIHSTKESQQLGTPLFENDEVRAVILDAVTRATEDFTPRYIAEIANVAKSHLLNRVSQTRGMTVGLTEADLTAHQFTPEDWEKAYNEVSSRYNKDEITRRDKELRDFVDKYLKVGMGFTAGSEVSGHTLFSETDTRRLRAIHETPVTQTQSPS